MDDVVAGQVLSEQAADDPSGVVEQRIYAEVSDLDGARVWLQDDPENVVGETEGMSAWLYREEFGTGLAGVAADEEEGEARTGEMGGAPHLDAENALVLGEALLQFSRTARGDASPPVVPVGKMAVAVSQAWQQGRGFRGDGSLDSEVFAQAILDALAEG